MFFVYKIYGRTTSKIGYMNKSKIFIYIAALGLMGFLCGGFLGFLVRPSFFKGMSSEKPSFKDVMTRGSYYPSLFDDVRSPYKSTAEDAFNIMVGGALLGLIGGVISGAGFFHKKDQEHDVNEGTIILPENPKEKTQAEAVGEKTWFAKLCPHCQYNGKFIVIERKPAWFTSIKGISGIILLLYLFWFRNSQYANEFIVEELPFLIIFGLQLIVLVVEIFFMPPKIYECPTCHFSKRSRRLNATFDMILTLILLSLGVIGYWFSHY